MNEVQDRARLYSALLHGNPANHPSTPTSTSGNIFQFNGHYSPSSMPSTSSGPSIGGSIGSLGPLPSPLASPGYLQHHLPYPNPHHAYLSAAYHHALSAGAFGSTPSSTPSSPFLMHPTSPSVSGSGRPSAFFPTPSLEQYHAAQQQAIQAAREREQLQRDHQQHREQEDKQSKDNQEVHHLQEPSRSHHRRYPIPPPLSSLKRSSSTTSSATSSPSPQTLQSNISGNASSPTSTSSHDKNNNDHGQEDQMMTSSDDKAYETGPKCYTRGTMIQLADGNLRRVEEMQTQDFLSCVQSTPDVAVDVSKVVKIVDTTDPTREPNVLITLSVGRRKTHFTVETPQEHPFFVYNKGWSSCSPSKTKQRYGLDARKLQVGDSCVSLLKAK